MSFNLEVSTQAFNVINSAQTTIHTYFNTQCKKGGAARVFTHLAGLPVGIASALIATTARVAKIGESIIKGLCNLFGSPFSSKCKAINGAKQLFLDCPSSMIALILSPLDFILVPPILMLSYLLMPKKTTEALGEVTSKTPEAQEPLPSNDTTDNVLDLIKTGNNLMEDATSLREEYEALASNPDATQEDKDKLRYDFLAAAAKCSDLEDKFNAI